MSVTSSVYFAQTSSPLGTIILVARGARLCGLYFEDTPDVLQHPNFDSAGAIENPAQRCCPPEVDLLFERVKRQLHAWFDRRTIRFDIPLCLSGTPFQQSVWRILQQIPYGHCLTYGQVSLRLTGNLRSSRAVGAAIGHNPVSIIVPCHRVIGADGRLTGFSGGLHRKSALLAHEGYLLV